MRRRPIAPLAVAVAVAVLSATSLARAASYALSPGMAQAAVAAQIDKLAAGDTLTLAPGDYAGIDLDLKHGNGSGIAGTASQPITIVGTPDASGALPHVTANADMFQEAVRVRSGCAYVTIQSLHLSVAGSMTQAGVFFDSHVHDIRIVDNLIESVTGIGVQLHSQSDIHDVLVEHNEITNTGTYTSDTNNGGQGFQAGGFTPSTATTGVYNLMVRRNLVHGITGQEGDCMALLYGVYASTFEDNVVYDCPRGVSGETENYGLISYGSGVGHYEMAVDDNVIQRNLVLGSAAKQTGHDNVGIYAGPGTIVANNVVVGSNQGIAARLESEATQMRNLSVVNNTVYDATDDAFSIRGCKDADSSVIVTGNAFVAVEANGYGYRMPDPLGAMIAKANFYSGLDYAEAAAPIMNKLSAAPSALFVHASATIPGADFMPAAGSELIDKADAPTAPKIDFDLAPRPQGAGPDVGAYESRADLSNHWSLALAFKGSFSAGDGGVASGPGAPIDPTPPAGSTGSGPGSAGSGAGSAGSGAPMDSADGGASATATPTNSSDGCGCTTAPAPHDGLPWLVLALLALKRRHRTHA